MKAPPTREFCQRLGGTRIYVPAAIGANHPIAVAIGMAAAARLASHFGGFTLDLPKAFLRRQRVLELRRTTSMTAAEIARATDYSERHVFEILANERVDDGQLDLFANL